jgi:hypothetical protein
MKSMMPTLGPRRKCGWDFGDFGPAAIFGFPRDNEHVCW